MGWWGGPHEAGDGGANDVERGRGRVSGLRERGDDTVEFVKAAWPAVDAKEWDGGWIG